MNSPSDEGIGDDVDDVGAELVVREDDLEVGGARGPFVGRGDAGPGAEHAASNVRNGATMIRWAMAVLMVDRVRLEHLNGCGLDSGYGMRSPRSHIPAPAAPV